MNMKLVIEADSATLVRILKLLDDAPAAPVSEQQLELPTVTQAVAAPEYTPTPPTATSEPMFDDTGLVWDERIHAPSKQKVADGSWRKRRNTEDAVYKAVEAELRAQYGQPVAAPVPVPVYAVEQPVAAPVHAVEQPVAVPVHVAYDAPVTLPVAAPAAVPVGNVAPVATVSGVVAVETVTSEPAIDFHGLMQEVGSRITAGTVQPDRLNQIIGSISAQYGVPLNTFTDLAAQPTLVPVAYNMLVSAQ